MAIQIGEGFIPVRAELDLGSIQNMSKNFGRHGAQVAKQFVGDFKDQIDRSGILDIDRGYPSGGFERRTMRFPEMQQAMRDQMSQTAIPPGMIESFVAKADRQMGIDATNAGVGNERKLAIYKGEILKLSETLGEASGLAERFGEVSDQGFVDLAIAAKAAGLSATETVTTLDNIFTQSSFSELPKTLTDAFDPELFRKFSGAVSNPEFERAVQGISRLAAEGAKTDQTFEQILRKDFKGPFANIRSSFQKANDAQEKFRATSARLSSDFDIVATRGRTVQEVLSVYAEGAEKGVGSASDAVKGLALEFKKAEKATLEAEAALKKMVTIATAPIAALALNEIRRGIGENLQLAQQFQSVYALLPDTSADAAQNIRRDAEGIAESFSLVPQQVIPALQSALRLQIPEDSALKFIEAVGPLASIGVADLGTAVSQTAFIIRQFDKDLDDAGDVANTFFQAFRSGVDINQLGGDVAQLSAQAGQLGVSFEELTAIYIASAQSGFRTAQTTTALRQALLRLTEPSEDLQEVLGATAEEFPALIQGAGGLIPFLADVSDVADENGEKFSSLVLGGSRYGQALLSIIPKAEEVSTITAELNDNQGELNEAFEAFGQGPAQSVLDFQLALGELRRVSTESGAALFGVLDSATPVIRAFAEAEGTVAEFARTGLYLVTSVLPLVARGLVGLGMRRTINQMRDAALAQGDFGEATRLASQRLTKLGTEAGSSRLKVAGMIGVLTAVASAAFIVASSFVTARDRIRELANNAADEFIRSGQDIKTAAESLFQDIQRGGIAIPLAPDIDQETLNDVADGLHTVGLSFEDTMEGILAGTSDIESVFGGINDEFDKQARILGSKVAPEINNIDDLYREVFGEGRQVNQFTEEFEDQAAALIAQRDALHKLKNPLADIVAEWDKAVKRARTENILSGDFIDPDIARLQRYQVEVVTAREGLTQFLEASQRGTVITGTPDFISTMATQLSDIRVLAGQLEQELPSIFARTFDKVQTISSGETLKIVQANRDGIEAFAGGVKTLQDAGFDVLADIVAAAGPDGGRSTLQGFLASLKAGNTDILYQITEEFIGVEEGVLARLAELNEIQFDGPSIPEILKGNLLPEDQAVFDDQFINGVATELDVVIDDLVEAIAGRDDSQRIAAGIAAGLDEEVRDALFAKLGDAEQLIKQGEVEALATAFGDVLEGVTIDVALVPTADGEAVKAAFFEQSLSGIVAGNDLLEHLVTDTTVKAYTEALIPDGMDAGLASSIQGHLKSALTGSETIEVVTDYGEVLGRAAADGLNIGFDVGGVGSGKARELLDEWAKENGVQSPAKEWIKMGRYLVQGLNKGIEGTRIASVQPELSSVTGGQGGSSRVYNVTYNYPRHTDPLMDTERIFGVIRTAELIG